MEEKDIENPLAETIAKITPPRPEGSYHRVGERVEFDKWCLLPEDKREGLTELSTRLNVSLPTLRRWQQENHTFRAQLKPETHDEIAEDTIQELRKMVKRGSPGAAGILLKALGKDGVDKKEVKVLSLTADDYFRIAGEARERVKSRGDKGTVDTEGGGDK